MIISHITEKELDKVIKELNKKLMDDVVSSNELDIGDKFIVVEGDYKGGIFIVDNWIINNDQRIIYPHNYYSYNIKSPLSFKSDECKKWTKKDQKIKDKFHELFELVEKNITRIQDVATSIVGRKNIDLLEQYHRSNLSFIHERYDLFLYKKIFNEGIIKNLNSINEEEKICKIYYCDIDFEKIINNSNVVMKFLFNHKRNYYVPHFLI